MVGWDSPACKERKCVLHSGEQSTRCAALDRTGGYSRVDSLKHMVIVLSFFSAAMLRGPSRRTCDASARHRSCHSLCFARQYNVKLSADAEVSKPAVKNMMHCPHTSSSLGAVPSRWVEDRIWWRQVHVCVGWRVSRCDLGRAEYECMWL